MATLESLSRRWQGRLYGLIIREITSGFEGPENLAQILGILTQLSVSPRNHEKIHWSPKTVLVTRNTSLIRRLIPFRTNRLSILVVMATARREPGD